MTLARRAFHSGMVVTASSLAIRLIHLGALVVLARILIPDDFGAVALALVIVSTGSLFSTVGMGSAVIASHADLHRAAFHAALLNLALGVALFCAVVALGEPLARLLGTPDLVTLFRAMSIVILLDTLSVVPDALLMKKLQFVRRAVAQLSAGIVQYGLAIVLALAGFGVWSLVAGHVAAATTRLICLAAFAPRIRWARPQPWDGELALDLFRFGATAMATSLVRHAYSNADNILIGRLFGTAALGFYSQSYNLTNIPVQSVSQVANAVLFPTYTLVRDDYERLAKGYASAFRLVAFLTMPLAVSLFLLAPQMVVTILGDQWRPSIVLLQILAGLALFRPLSGTTSPLFLSINRPGLNFITAVVQAASMAPLLILLYPLGATGIAAAVTGTFAFGFIFNMWQVMRRTPVPVSVRGLALGVLPIAVACVVMALCVVLARSYLAKLGVDLESVLTLLVLVLVGMASYGGAVFLFDRALVSELVGLIRTRRTASANPEA